MRFTLIFIALISLTNLGNCNTKIENAISTVETRIATMRSQGLSDVVVLRYALKESGGDCFPVAIAALRLNIKAPSSTSIQESRDKTGMHNLSKILSNRDVVQCITILQTLWKESSFNSYPPELRKLLLFGQLDCVKDRWTSSKVSLEEHTLLEVDTQSLHDIKDQADKHEMASTYPVVDNLFLKDEMQRISTDALVLMQMAEKIVLSALGFVLLAIVLPLVIYHFVIRRKLLGLEIRNEVLNKELVRHSQDQEALMSSVRSYLEQGGQQEMAKVYHSQKKDK
jgi:hypothetical protein